MTPPPKKSDRQTTRIFLVDDHPLICEGLEQLINQNDSLCVCGYATDARTALKNIKSHHPDLTIVDIFLEGKSGLELISEIRESCPKTLILALSMHSDPLTVDRALKAGAMGYVGKNEVSTVIIEAIQSVLKGKIYLSGTLSERLLDSIYRKNNHPDGDLLISKLTSREFEIFQLIGQELSTREIAKELHISTKTVDAHRENIKSKLHLKNARELYVYSFQWAKSFE